MGIPSLHFPFTWPLPYSNTNHMTQIFTGVNSVYLYIYTLKVLNKNLCYPTAVDIGASTEPFYINCRRPFIEHRCQALSLGHTM